MPVTVLKLTDEFVAAAVAGGCTTEIILQVQQTLSAHPTGGRKLVDLYDDPLILPGSGWYQNSHHYTVKRHPLAFDTLHLNIAPNVRGRLVGFLLHGANVVQFVSYEQRQRLREVGLMIAGRAFLREEY